MKPSPLPDLPVSSFGASLETINSRFEQQGVLGVMVISAPVLAEIECSYGHEARTKALSVLSGTALRLAHERLEIDDLVVSGETGRNEVLVLLFREHRDAHFYNQELPGLEGAIHQTLERQGKKVFYPYLRRLPELPTGTGIALRNPRLSVESQVREAVEEARRDADLNGRIKARRRRMQMLELVLDRRVTSVYEPIVDVASRTVFGYEALARGPEGSDLRSPVALFDLAVRENLVFELDCLCRASGLEGAIDYPPGMKLFLNIRPTTIHDPNFRAERLIETLARCALSPSDVVFEICEQEGIQNFDVFREIRDYYRGLGFQIALDDTGAGYAGLEALLELSPEFIKVDRSFVSGIDQDTARQNLLGALQEVARKSGARMIGEGLDTLEELEMLGELGIEFGQGWLFGKPTPLRAVSRL